MVTKQDVLDSLQEVFDPELQITIVELGLVYDVKFEQKDEGTHAEIDLTLTSPGCPVAPEIMANTHRACIEDRRSRFRACESCLESTVGSENSCIR